MKSSVFPVLFVCLLTIITIGCDRPACKNTNPVFDKYSPDSKEYKSELANQLKGINLSELRYWLNDYKEMNGREQIWFNIQGEGLCAVIVMNVESWNKLELVREKKGVSFHGAEFKNLKFEIRQNESDISFIYKDLEKIID